MFICLKRNSPVKTTTITRWSLFVIDVAAVVVDYINYCVSSCLLFFFLLLLLILVVILQVNKWRDCILV